MPMLKFPLSLLLRSRCPIVQGSRRMAEAPGVFQRRIVIGAGLCVAAFALVGIRLVDVTLMQASLHGGASDHAVLPRADLTDRNGELLARDLPVKDLYARPHVFWDKQQAAHDL